MPQVISVALTAWGIFMRVLVITRSRVDDWVKVVVGEEFGAGPAV